jgi:hypothetical protein
VVDIAGVNDDVDPIPVLDDLSNRERSVGSCVHQRRLSARIWRRRRDHIARARDQLAELLSRSGSHRILVRVDGDVRQVDAGKMATIGRPKAFSGNT